MWGQHGDLASPPLASLVPVSFAVAAICLTFFAASVVFWTYSWWRYDRPESIDAVRYAVIFWCAGLASLVLWRVTSR